MKNLILTIATVFISTMSFSQLEGMEQYEPVKKYKFKDGEQGYFDLFGTRNYYFVYSDSNDHLDELFRIADANGVSYEDLHLNTYIESIEAEVETFITEKGLTATIIKVSIE